MNLNENIMSIIDDFKKAQNIEEIVSIIKSYRKKVLFYKIPEYNITISQYKIFDNSIFIKPERCYVEKRYQDYRRNVDYHPLINCNYKNVNYYGCQVDLNYYKNVTCPPTFYKNIKYTYEGRKIKDIIDSDENISLQHLLKKIRQIGGLNTFYYEKYIKYKNK